MPTLQAAVEKLLLLTDKMTLEANQLSFGAQFTDFESVKKIARSIKSDRFAYYFWSPVRDAQMLRRSELASIRQAHLVFGQRRLSIAPNHTLPPYDWDGLPQETANLTFSETFAEPVDELNKKGNSDIAERIGRSASAGGGDSPAKITTSLSSKSREHLYITTVARDKAVDVARAICEEFDLREGVGSFECLGSVETLEPLVSEKTFRTTEFPTGCWSFNATSFALERTCFLKPVLNVSRSELGEVARVIDGLGATVKRSMICRRYLSWRLADRAASPRAQGNYVLLSSQNGGYSMFVGFEQCADTDPSVKQFVAASVIPLSELGVTLKKVAYVS